MEFLKKLFGRGQAPLTEQQSGFRGVSAVQSQEEQDATRAQMEEEMAGQKESREAATADEKPAESDQDKA
jgi:hypothetical protein